MPSKSEAQHRLMEGVAHNPKFARQVGIPEHVGEEFVRADAQDCKASGVMYVAGDEVLLMRRAEGQGDQPGTWSLPAGGREDGETAIDAAARESAEETGFYPSQANLKTFSRTNDFVTFVHHLKDKFEPVRNAEHDDHRWFPLNDLPEPMHPGLKASLGKDMTPSDWDGFVKGFVKWAAEEESEPAHAEDAEPSIQADKFIWEPGQIKIIHEGTEEAPEPEDEIEEIDEADVKPNLELDITA